MKKLVLYIPVALLLLTFTSCSKDADDIIPDYLYGTWKITNGDTLTLARVNIANCDLNYGPVRKRSDYPFTFRNEKLGIKAPSFNSTGEYRFFDSFRWIQPGQSFEILQIQWFPLSSSTNTYYTFTKIP
ncbi:MAG: hypothetical protein V4557_19395 [Bacteroidota bacterium]